LTVGFSKPAIYNIPKGVTLKVDKDLLTVAGCDKQLVGQVAANIRGIKPPEPYKGKGIRYQNEYIKLKEGKSAK
jgi:large subunit ribosomal protein L6